MIPLISKVLTFLSGCSATVAAYGVAGDQSGIPKWLILLCIVLTGEFAKASIGALPVNKADDGTTPPKGG